MRSAAETAGISLANVAQADRAGEPPTPSLGVQRGVAVEVLAHVRAGSGPSLAADPDGTMQFEDRTDAGRRLGRALLAYAGRDVLVVGLPRGGVPVAFEVADMLLAPLDVWVVRKLGVPFHPELGMGAIAEGPALVLDRDLIARLGISSREVTEVVRREADEVHRRVVRFRGQRPAPVVEDGTVIVVDDGIATGGTTRAAIKGLRKRGARQVVLAAPVASPEVIAALRPLVDDVVCMSQPRDLMAIGAWYEDFEQVPDAEVTRLLQAARSARASEEMVARAHRELPMR